jgi:hypothetical protein
MNYHKLIFRENSRPEPLGDKTITIDFDLNEIFVDSMAEGVKWCRIGSRERSTIEAKLNESRPDEWADDYSEPVPDGSRWDLRLFDGNDLVKESCGYSGYPPREQWQALSSLVAFCFAVARRYGEYRPPRTSSAPTSLPAV